jgi:hypothetical protein
MPGECQGVGRGRRGRWWMGGGDGGWWMVGRGRRGRKGEKG